MEKYEPTFAASHGQMLFTLIRNMQHTSCLQWQKLNHDCLITTRTENSLRQYSHQGLHTRVQVTRKLGFIREAFNDT